jgi:hypothetical protein
MNPGTETCESCLNNYLLVNGYREVGGSYGKKQKAEFTADWGSDIKVTKRYE